jgi:hypothetical protein
MFFWKLWIRDTMSSTLAPPQMFGHQDWNFEWFSCGRWSWNISKSSLAQKAMETFHSASPALAPSLLTEVFIVFLSRHRWITLIYVMAFASRVVFISQIFSYYIWRQIIHLVGTHFPPQVKPLKYNCNLQRYFFKNLKRSPIYTHTNCYRFRNIQTHRAWMVFLMLYLVLLALRDKYQRCYLSEIAYHVPRYCAWRVLHFPRGLRLHLWHRKMWRAR